MKGAHCIVGGMDAQPPAWVAPAAPPPSRPRWLRLLLLPPLALAVLGAAWLWQRQRREALQDAWLAAAATGNRAEMERCLAAGVDVNFRHKRPWPVGGFKENALWTALLRKDFDTATFLMQKGALLEPDPGRPALEKSWDPDILRFCLAHGADPCAPHGAGWLPVHHAICRMAPAAVIRILAEGVPEDLPLAIVLGRPDRVEALSDLSHPLFKEAPPLLLAIAYGQSAVLGRLLAKGLDPCARGPRGHTWHITPMALAVRQGREDMVRILRDAGAPVEGLGVAASAGNAPFVRLLLAHGADPRQIDFNGGLLHFAQSTEVVDLLVAAGADLEARGTGKLYTDTPLERAVRTGRLEAAKALVAHGARIPQDLARHLENPARHLKPEEEKALRDWVASLRPGTV